MKYIKWTIKIAHPQCSGDIWQAACHYKYMQCEGTLNDLCSEFS